MSIKSKHTTQWLYSENEDFVQGNFKHPVNESEILYNLRWHHGVTELEPPVRITIGVIAYLLCILMIYSTGVWLRIEIQQGLFSNSIWVSLVAPIGLGGAIFLFGREALNLLVHRTQKVQEDWNLLVKNGRLLEVDSLDTQSKVPNLQLTYTFRNPKGKKITGKYFMRGKALANPSASPKVLYVNDRLHTLL